MRFDTSAFWADDAPYLPILRHFYDLGLTERLSGGQPLAESEWTLMAAASVAERWKALGLSAGHQTANHAGTSIPAALCQVAAVTGYWLGTNHDQLPVELTSLLVLRRSDELSPPAASVPTPPPAALPPPDSPSPHLRLLSQGTAQPLPGAKSQRLISVILPVKNGAAHLPALLPRLFGQRFDASLEIIAVDSGSSDATLDVLREFGCTILAVHPRAFNHGTTRNLAAGYARGDVLVFITHRIRPVGDNWLAALVAPLDADPTTAAVESHTLPRPDADPLTIKDEIRGALSRSRLGSRSIQDWDQYRGLTADERLDLFSFRTVSSAIRPEVLARIPFRELPGLGEDMLWAREVLEAGFTIRRALASLALHSHNYAHIEWLRSMFDAGLGFRSVAGMHLSAADLIPTLIATIEDDWRYLQHVVDLSASELAEQQITAVLRRAARTVGLWFGTRDKQPSAELVQFLSLIARVRANVATAEMGFTVEEPLPRSATTSHDQAPSPSPPATVPGDGAWQSSALTSAWLADIHALEACIRAYDAEHRAAWDELGRRTQVITHLQAELHAKVAERDAMIRALQAELHAKVGERDRQIRDLQAELQQTVGNQDRPIHDRPVKVHANMAADFNPLEEATTLPTIALLAWGDLWEDFLDTLGVTMESFRKEFVGSWMFGYVEALRRAGVQTVIYCVSARTKKPTRFTHVPTGATICLLPSPWPYLAVRRARETRNGRTPHASDRSTAWTAFNDGLWREVAPYLTLPLLHLARELRRDRCQAILCQQYEYPRFDMCVPLGRLLGIPVFATYQGGGDSRLPWLAERLRPRALQACAGLIIPTQTEMQRVRLRWGVQPSRVARIFNPIDLSVWYPVDRAQARTQLGIPHDAQVVIWHGRVDVGQKGLDILLDAWREVCARRPTRDLRLLLVGTGPDRATLKRYLDATDQRNVVWHDRFIHDRETIRQFLSAADIYVLPSRDEGFPVAPLEAMACGLPVVATDASGIPDILERGEHSGGLIVPTNDTAALSLELGRVLDDAPWRATLGQRARRRIETAFSLDVVGPQLRAFLLREPGAISNLVWTDERVSAPQSSSAQSPLILHAISPSEVQARSAFNVQPDGQSALSVSAGNATRATLVAMGDTLLVTAYGNPSHLSALVPNHLLSTPGRYSVYLTDGIRQSATLEFVVAAQPLPPTTQPREDGDVSSTDAPPPPVLVALHPARTSPGQGFNVQANGYSALSVTCEQATPETTITLDDTPLATTYGDSTWLTALVPPHVYAQPGCHRIGLLSDGRRSQTLEFIVE